MPSQAEKELKKDIRHRISDRLCKRGERDGRFILRTTVHHVTTDNIELKKRPKTFEMRFTCFMKKAYLLETKVFR